MATFKKLICCLYASLGTLNFNFVYEIDPSGIGFLNVKSCAQSHFTLYAELLRSFFRHKNLAQSINGFMKSIPAFMPQKLQDYCVEPIMLLRPTFSLYEIGPKVKISGANPIYNFLWISRARGYQ